MKDEKKKPQSFWQKVAGRCKKVSPVLLLSVAVVINTIGDFLRDVRINFLIDVVADLQQSWINFSTAFGNVFQDIEYFIKNF